MGNVLSGLKPELIWNYFENICEHPRPSRKEEKIAAYVISVAKENGLDYNVDDFGNIVVRKPATPGMEDRKTVVLQGHLDMVAEKNNDVMHDFDNDPIVPLIDGDWVKAKGTTLGSDNGIGVAASLALMKSKEVKHGPLEFLFTLDEETGLFGAQALKPGFLKADILLNLDSEEDGALYIGCAGGKNSFITFKYESAPIPENFLYYSVQITGLKGGHSGLDIQVGRGNALKILSRLLWNALIKFNLKLSSFDGGSKHNAIPRESSAVIAVDAKDNAAFNEFVEKYNELVKSEYESLEPNLLVKLHTSDKPIKIMTDELAKRLVGAMYTVPNGVIKMSPDIPGLVETSTNLAVIVTEPERISLTLSQRSSVESEKEDIAATINAVFSLNGAEVKHGDGYPGWKPNIHSPVLGTMKVVFKELFGNEPEVKAIHAGLECGIINERYPDMDMISFGPTIMGAHSPDERVQISTVSKFWDLLLKTLENIPKN